MLRVALLLAAAVAAQAQQPAVPFKEGDFVARDFTFHTGETLAELKLHYTTAGEPRRDADGKVRNAILVMHGTGGTGRPFLGAVIGAIAGGGKGAAIGAGAGAGAGALTQTLTKGGSIKVPAESVLTFELDKPLRVRVSE